MKKIAVVAASALFFACGGVEPEENHIILVSPVQPDYPVDDAGVVVDSPDASTVTTEDAGEPLVDAGVSDAGVDDDCREVCLEHVVVHYGHADHECQDKKVCVKTGLKCHKKEHKEDE